MHRIDVEEQLRMQQQAMHSEVAKRLSSVSFLHLEYLEAVSDAATVVVSTTLVAVLVMLLSSVAVKSIATRCSMNLKRTRLAFPLHGCTPLAFSCVLSVWLVLLGGSALASFMQLAAQMMEQSARGSASTAHIPHDGIRMQLPDWPMQSPALQFFISVLGVVMVWVFVLLVNSRMEFGAMGALLPFFASLYRSLLIAGDEPDRLAVWFIHCSFFASILMLYVTAQPWMMEEYRVARRELSDHTLRALYRERPEKSHLITRDKSNRKTS